MNQYIMKKGSGPVLRYLWIHIFFFSGLSSFSTTRWPARVPCYRWKETIERTGSSPILGRRLSSTRLRQKRSERGRVRWIEYSPRTTCSTTLGCPNPAWIQEWLHQRIQPGWTRSWRQNLAQLRRGWWIQILTRHRWRDVRGTRILNLSMRTVNDYITDFSANS